MPSSENMKNLYKRLTVIKTKKEGLMSSIEELNKMISDNQKNLDVYDSCLDIIRSFQIWINENTKRKLESITNEALSLIFPDKEMRFMVNAKQTRVGIKYELAIETDGIVTDLLDAKGGGVLDVIQLCLRITYLMRLGNVRKLLVLDEPLKNLDSERINLAVEWIYNISQMFGIQMVIITHIPAMIFQNDKVTSYEVRLKNGVSVLNENCKAENN